MNGRKREPIRATPRQRAGIVIVGVMLMLPGITALFAGSLFYTDYRNLPVFAPFMLLIGVVMIIFALRVGKGQVAQAILPVPAHQHSTIAMPGASNGFVLTQLRFLQ